VAVEIVMPRLSDAMEEGTIVGWLVSVGDTVHEGAPLVEVETDKATVVYESEHEGTILELSADVGASVAVGALIAVIGALGEEPAATPARGPGAPSERPATDSVGLVAALSQASSGAGKPPRVKASPLARRIATELGVDLATLVGSGPQGRVIRADVVAAAPSVGAAAARHHDGSAKGETSTEELTRLERTVARRMSQSRATVPDFELRSMVDMTQAVALREQLRAIRDPPPSYNDLIIKAAALALREFPRVNGSYRDEQIEHHARVNVGIAVAAEDALVVPTIFDADRKSVAEITQLARTLAARVRDGSITPGELSGATFSVTNLGMYGVDSFSAVINPPQAAILAVGALKPRAIVDQTGAVVARPTVELTLACDHRILYGAGGARFLGRVKELLERPVTLLL
jgi:pyruvate dehydrogenase E2 component (dihydrolipoamide acetyltransferase)